MLYLKEHKKVALHVACGDITNAKIDGDQLVVRSSDSFLIDVLESGRKEIESVTLEDIQEAATHLKKDTIVLLKGVQNDEEDE